MVFSVGYSLRRRQEALERVTAVSILSEVYRFFRASEGHKVQFSSSVVDGMTSRGCDAVLILRSPKSLKSSLIKAHFGSLGVLCFVVLKQPPPLSPRAPVCGTVVCEFSTPGCVSSGRSGIFR